MVNQGVGHHSDTGAGTTLLSDTNVRDIASLTLLLVAPNAKPEEAVGVSESGVFATRRDSNPRHRVRGDSITRP